MLNKQELTMARLYKSKKYNSQHTKDKAENVFIVLNDNERIILKEKYIQLIKILIANMPNNFNAYDMEMIQFIPKMFLWDEKREDCVMLDPAYTQLVKVDKMLAKVPGIPSTFLDWLDVDLEEHPLTPSGMKTEMDRRRKLKKRLEMHVELKQQQRKLVDDILDWGDE